MKHVDPEVQEMIDRWSGKPPLRDGIVILAALIAVAAFFYFRGWWH